MSKKTTHIRQKPEKFRTRIVQWNDGTMEIPLAVRHPTKVYFQTDFCRMAEGLKDFQQTIRVRQFSDFCRTSDVVVLCR